MHTLEDEGDRIVALGDGAALPRRPRPARGHPVEGHPPRPRAGRRQLRARRSRAGEHLPQEPMSDGLLVVIVAVALAFDFTNGFHDTANAVATSVSTRALSPRDRGADRRHHELPGAFTSTAVAKTVGDGLINTDPGRVTGHLIAGGAHRRDRLEPLHVVPRPAVVVVARAGRRAGRGRAGGRRAGSGAMGRHLEQGGRGRGWPARVIGFVLAGAIMVGDPVALPARPPGAAQPRVPACADRVGQLHGVRPRDERRPEDDGRHRARALLRGPHELADRHPELGDRGWPRPPSPRARTSAAGGSCARWARGSSSSSPRRGSPPRRPPARVLYTVATRYGFPVSTTHVISSSVMGAGATTRVSAVRWGVAADIVTAWLLTIPAAGLVAAGHVRAPRRVHVIFT